MSDETRSPFRDRVKAIDASTSLPIKLGTLGALLTTAWFARGALDVQLTTISGDHAAIVELQNECRVLPELKSEVDQLVVVCGATVTATGTAPMLLNAWPKTVGAASGQRGRLSPITQR